MTADVHALAEAVRTGICLSFTHTRDDALDALAAFAEWLIGMDGPENVDGREERRSVTLTKIIAAARAAAATETAKEDTDAQV